MLSCVCKEEELSLYLTNFYCFSFIVAESKVKPIKKKNNSQKDKINIFIL